MRTITPIRPPSMAGPTHRAGSALHTAHDRPNPLPAQERWAMASPTPPAVQPCLPAHSRKPMTLHPRYYQIRLRATLMTPGPTPSDDP